MLGNGQSCKKKFTARALREKASSRKHSCSLIDVGADCSIENFSGTTDCTSRESYQKESFEFRYLVCLNAQADGQPTHQELESTACSRTLRDNMVEVTRPPRIRPEMDAQASPKPQPSRIIIAATSLCRLRERCQFKEDLRKRELSCSMYRSSKYREIEKKR